MKSFWSIVNDRLAGGENAFVARVVEHTAHSPGTTGAGLVVTESGETHGTIGGGVMEFKVIELARKALENNEFQPQIQTLDHHAHGAGEPSGLICAGHQTNLYYLCRPEAESAVVAQAARAQDSGAAGLLSIAVSGMTFTDAKREPLRIQSKLERQEDGWRYVEQMLNLRRIAILGGGHCGLALSRVMNQLGYEVSIFDERPDAPAMRDLGAVGRRNVVQDLARVGPAIPYADLTDIVVMTTDLESDVRALSGVLEGPFPFVGVMGSKAKISAIKKALRLAGLTEESISRLTAPVGLPIGSNTPDEIAISISAQLLQIRAGTVVAGV